MYLREQNGDMAVGTKVFGYVAKFPTGGTNIPIQKELCPIIHTLLNFALRESVYGFTRDLP